MNRNPFSGDTLQERLELACSVNEATAKWLSLSDRRHDPDEPLAQVYEETNNDLTELLQAKPDLMNLLLWQMARLIAEIQIVAVSHEIDVTHGLAMLKSAMEGTLYEND